VVALERNQGSNPIALKEHGMRTLFRWLIVGLSLHASAAVAKAPKAASTIDWGACIMEVKGGLPALTCPHAVVSFNPRFGGADQVQVMANRERLPNSTIVRQTLQIEGRAVEVVRYQRRSKPDQHAWLTQLDGKSIVCGAKLEHAAQCEEILSLGLRGALPLDKTGARPFLGRALPVGPDCRRLDTLDVRCDDKSRFTAESVPDPEEAMRIKTKQLTEHAVARSAVKPLRCTIEGVSESVPCQALTVCPPGEEPLTAVLAVSQHHLQTLFLTCSWWEANGPAPGAACRSILKPLKTRFPLACTVK
jgi:hypothetical protein